MTKPKGWVRPPLPTFKPIVLGDVSVEEVLNRLAKMVEPGLPDNECWPANGYKSYPSITINGKGYAATRVVCTLHHGEIPDGYHVAHSCDNPRCINPKHLEAVTPSENARQAVERNLKKHPIGERCGTSKMTEQQVRAAIAECKATGHGYRRIAKKLGLPPSAVKDMLSGRSWQHITGGKPVAKINHLNSRENSRARRENLSERRSEVPR